VLGAYPTSSLAEARQACDEARRLLEKGVDPLEAKKEQKRAAAPDDTFRIIAEEYVAWIEKEGRADATITKTEWLLDFAYPTLGHLSVREIDPPTVLEVLRQVEARGRYESARRLRSMIGTVFRYAIATAQASNDPTIALRGAPPCHRFLRWAAWHSRSIEADGAVVPATGRATHGGMERVRSRQGHLVNK
jgi:hypothetical protein